MDRSHCTGQWTCVHWICSGIRYSCESSGFAQNQCTAPSLIRLLDLRYCSRLFCFKSTCCYLQPSDLVSSWYLIATCIGKALHCLDPLTHTMAPVLFSFRQVDPAADGMKPAHSRHLYEYGTGIQLHCRLVCLSHMLPPLRNHVSKRPC